MIPTPKAKLGRVLLVFVFVQLFLVLEVAPPAILYLHGVDDLSSPALRLVLTLGFVYLVVFGSLCFLMWKGYGWARWVASFILFGMGFFALTFVSDVQGAARSALLGSILYQLILAAYLAFSQSLDHFIREQERFRKINL